MGVIFAYIVFFGVILLVLINIKEAIEKPRKRREELEKENQKKIDREIAASKAAYERSDYVIKFFEIHKSNIMLLQKLNEGLKLFSPFMGLNDKIFYEDYDKLYYKIKDYEKETEEKLEKERIEKIARERQRIKSSRVGALIELSIGTIENSNNQSGVYLIVNNKTLDFYIGESQNMGFRKKTHIGDLALGEHHSKLMQKHFNEYGVKVFDFYCLETFLSGDDNVRKYSENRWIKEYQPTYNNTI